MAILVFYLLDYMSVIFISYKCWSQEKCGAWLISLLYFFNVILLQYFLIFPVEILLFINDRWSYFQLANNFFFIIFCGQNHSP